MIPREFEYHAPATLPDALGLLQQYGDEAKLLAGGHSLLPMMKLRFAQPSHLVDLGRIAELKGIREDGGTLVIGAMTTEREIIESGLLQTRCPLLVEGARQISDPQVRYRGRSAGTSRTATPATTIRR
jgi:carbon-monoxide dehydrogenase medium subunit